MIKRICLITPPSIFLLDERVFMTLGILKVAAVLEQAGIEVEMLDLSGVENYEEVVRDHVRGGSATCYGLTATTPQMPAATKICRAIRALNPSARIILGGPHVTLIHAAYKFEQKRGATGRATTAFRLLEDMYDVLVVGDGEIAIFEALGDNPPKLVDGDDPKSDLFLTNQRLTELPFPARHLIDVDSYQYTIDGVMQERFHHISHRVASDGSDGDPIADADLKHHRIDLKFAGYFRDFIIAVSNADKKSAFEHNLINPNKITIDLILNCLLYINEMSSEKVCMNKY